MCKINENIYLITKVIIPIILLIIGFIKLTTINNTKKSIIKFLKCIILALILVIATILIQGRIKNRCNEYNKEEPQIEKQEPIDDNNNVVNTVKEEHKIEQINGATYIDGILIVNKTYSIPSTFKPSNATSRVCNKCLSEETLNAFNEMSADASAINLNLYISSGYRSYEYQEELYDRYKARDGKELADTYSARPGHSEHQTGLAFDLNSIDDSFANTQEGMWVKDNCYRYGLILRYPKGKEKETGYQYESWHLRYVGKDLAEKLYNNGNWITLEEYFNIESNYEV